jgi:hypothetical protein
MVLKKGALRHRQVYKRILRPSFKRLILWNMDLIYEKDEGKGAIENGKERKKGDRAHNKCRPYRG